MTHCNLLLFPYLKSLTTSCRRTPSYAFLQMLPSLGGLEFLSINLRGSVRRESLTGLSSLTGLEIAVTAVDSIAFVSCLKAMRHIDVNCNHWSGCLELTSLSCCTALQVRSCYLFCSWWNHCRRFHCIRWHTPNSAPHHKSFSLRSPSRGSHVSVLTVPIRMQALKLASVPDHDGNLLAALKRLQGLTSLSISSSILLYGHEGSNDQYSDGDPEYSECKRLHLEAVAQTWPMLTGNAVAPCQTQRVHRHVEGSSGY